MGMKIDAARAAFIKAMDAAGIRGVRENGRRATMDFEVWYKQRFSALERGFDGYDDFVRKAKLWWKIHQDEYRKY